MEINQRRAGAGLTYLYMGLGFLISLIFTPVMLRLLGQSEYGLYNLVASVVAYLGVLNFGFGSAYVRYFSRYDRQDQADKLASLNGMFLTLFTLLGLIAVLAGLLLARHTDLLFGSKLDAGELSRARVLMIILVINLGFSFPSIVFTSHITARERFVFQRLIQLVKVVASPFFVLLALLLGFGSIGMALATSLVNLAVELVYAAYCLGKLKMTFSFRGMDKGLMREVTVFSSYIFINMVIDQVNWNVDKFIIGRIQGTASVAIYGVAATLQTYYQQVSTAISNVFIPRVHQIVAHPGEDQKELTRLFTRIGRIQFMILGYAASVLIFFGKPFILKWAGPAYGDAYYVALFLILPVTIPLIQTLGIEVQRAKNMHQFRSWAYLFMALGNLLVSIPLTIRFGPAGAAAGTGLSMIIGNGLIMNLYNHYKVGLDMGYFWKAIGRFIPALIPPILSGVLMVSFVDLNRLPLLIGMGLLYTLIFSLSFWFLGMNPYEKDLVRSPFRRRP